MTNRMTNRPSPLDFERVYEHFAQSAVDLFNKDGNVTQQLFAVRLARDVEGEVDAMIAIDPTITQRFYESDDSKKALKHFIQHFLAEDGVFREGLRDDNKPLPDIMVQISEIWHVEEKEKPKPENYVPPCEHPDRKEGVMVVLHTALHSIAGTCPILDTPKRHCQFKPLPKDRQFSGRMTMQGDNDTVSH